MKEISRRNFLKVLGIGTATAVDLFIFGIEGLNIFEKFENYYTSLDFLDGLKPSPYPLPESLRGITLNSPFLWKRDNDYVRWVESQAEKLGAKTVRVFINDDFEPELGRKNYNDKVLENIKRIAPQLSGAKLIVSLFDTYSLLHQDKSNAHYPPSPLSSPYFLESTGQTKAQKQLSIFENQNIKSCLFQRIDYCVRNLNSTEQIAAWEIANEPELDNRELFTDWFKERVDVVRKIDADRPIITGLANPSLIDENQLVGKNVVNSFHAYPFHLAAFAALTKYVPKSILPLAGLETGIGENQGSVIDYPLFLFRVLTSVISENTLYTGNVGLWKIDDYTDGYDVSDSPYSGYFRNLSEKLKLIQNVAM
jgi:hypothetical protein